MEHILAGSNSWVWIFIAFMAMVGVFLFVSVIAVKVYKLLGKLFGWESEDLDIEISDGVFSRHLHKQVELMDLNRSYDRNGFKQ